MLGPQDLWVALALGVFFFGAKKLPELSRSLGQAMSEFKKGVTGTSDEQPPVSAGRTRQAGGRVEAGRRNQGGIEPAKRRRELDPGGNEAVDGREEGRDLERLGDVPVHPGFEAALAVALHGVGRHGDDRDVLTARGPLALADRGGGLEAVHLRHLHVHEDQVERLGAPAPRAPPCPLAATTTSCAPLFQQPHRQLLVDGVVLGQEDAQAAAATRRSGWIVTSAPLLGRGPAARAPCMIASSRSDCLIGLVR